MRAQSNTAESHQHHQHRRGKDAQSLPALRFHQWQQKQKQLTIKQSGSDGMPASETVARPIDEPAIEKWTMPMHRKLEYLVREHAAGDGHDDCHKSGPSP